MESAAFPFQKFLSLLNRTFHAMKTTFSLREKYLVISNHSGVAREFY
jgi:hypothetical protein